ncbi:MAG TPA: acetyl-CoA carboxylase biotin carboxyl carrier protein, partial [Casimicrobiaceae bacterium]|nr:acetyl-CoA carboxylase biotin carboxyl carrier protein [Casimicrobiaceae bacterium]
MDLRKLKTLIELVETSGIAELEIQEGEERVRITRSLAGGGPPPSATAPSPHVALAGAPAASDGVPV